MRAADIEGVVAMHTTRRAGQLVRQGIGVGRGRISVRHFEHSDDPAQHRTAAAGLQIFLPVQARLTEMHLGIDYAGHDG